MLYDCAVEPATLALLKKLMAVSELSGFSLVGGTALALRYGHRRSIDLDLFSPQKFDTQKIIQALENNFSGFTYKGDDNPVGLFAFIDGVKVDFVQQHYHKLIDKITDEQGIRIFGNRDMMAMKVFAILKRAQKKDFWDVDELLRHYSVEEMVNCYYEKYPGQMLAISIPFALAYFADADESEDPVSLKGQTWESVKKHIQEKVREYLK